ncbi:glycosyltransferase family 2 protein [candidate division WOR-3 bacterium]|nr:glycosyltransferase family 2 protein [candidate division WOR-3 bacterium]
MDISCVIPVFNEEENVLSLYKALKSVLDGLNRSYEIIFIDDGSTDSTFDKLKAIPEIKVIQFTKNFGQTQAIQAGFDNANGDIIITLDGDLQNDPNDIPKLIDKLNEGYDIVSGWRKKRRDPISKKIPSFIANKVIVSLTKVRLHDFGCTLKAYRKTILNGLKLYGEMHRFIPAILSFKGARITELEVNHKPRKFGTPKYGLSRTPRVILDVIAVRFFLSSASSPIQLIGLWGIISIIVALISGIITIIMKIGPRKVDITGNPLLYLTILLIIIGIQFIILGLLGEIISRTYYESQNKPTYVVKKY